MNIDTKEIESRVKKIIGDRLAVFVILDGWGEGPITIRINRQTSRLLFIMHLNEPNAYEWKMLRYEREEDLGLKKYRKVKYKKIEQAHNRLYAWLEDNKIRFEGLR